MKGLSPIRERHASFDCPKARAKLIFAVCGRLNISDLRLRTFTYLNLFELCELCNKHLCNQLLEKG